MTSTGECLMKPAQAMRDLFALSEVAQAGTAEPTRIFRGKTSRPIHISGYDREVHEVACHRVAAGAGVAPAVLDAAPDGTWILMDYVEGGMWTPARLQAPEGLSTLGAASGTCTR
jgi:hypothetical protein